MAGRIISLTVAVGYILFAGVSGGGLLVFKILLYLIVGLVCIWFGDELGSLTGFSMTRKINISEKTPGSFVAVVGWLILLLVPGVLCALWFFQ